MVSIKLKEQMAEHTHLNLKEQLSLRERVVIDEAMDASQGNKSLASRILGISRTTLNYKLAQYDKKNQLLAESLNNLIDISGQNVL